MLHICVSNRNFQTLSLPIKVQMYHSHSEIHQQYFFQPMCGTYFYPTFYRSKAATQYLPQLHNHSMVMKSCYFLENWTKELNYYEIHKSYKPEQTSMNKNSIFNQTEKQSKGKSIKFYVILHNFYYLLLITRFSYCLFPIFSQYCFSFFQFYY